MKNKVKLYGDVIKHFTKLDSLWWIANWNQEKRHIHVLWDKSVDKLKYKKNQLIIRTDLKFSILRNKITKPNW